MCYGRLCSVYVGNVLGTWLLDAGIMRFWESNNLTASQRRISMTQCVGGAATEIGIKLGVGCRGSLFEKTGLATTTDGSDYDGIKRETVQGEYSVVGVNAAEGCIRAIVCSDRGENVRRAQAPTMTTWTGRGAGVAVVKKTHWLA